MKKLINLFIVLFVSLSLSAQDKGVLEYDRSSLCIMMVYHPEDEFAYNICQVFDSLPFPDKYDNHNVGTRIIDFNTFCNVKEKNETYAFRGSDESIRQNNQRFYQALQDNNAIVKSPYYQGVYAECFDNIVQKVTKGSSSIYTMTKEEWNSFYNSIPQKQRNRIDNGVQKIPVGLHKAKYGKILSKQEIETNAKAIELVLNENQYAKMMVARWFNLTGNTVGDAVFDMSTVKERGNYNATQTDVSLALQTARGLALLSDMGENLINNSYVLVNDISYVTFEEKAAVAKMTTGIVLSILGGLKGTDVTNTINSVNAIADSFTGFNVKTHSYLYRLQWNDSVAGIFYEKYYTDVPDSAKVMAFLNDTSTFKMEYVAHEYEYSQKTTLKGFYDRQDLIKMSCARSIDKNIAALQLQYEDFKVKTPIRSVITDKNGRAEGYCAEIGLKEGITEKSSFQVIQRMFDEKNNRTYYKYIATVKPVKGKIWDNRYNAAIENATEAGFSYTTFKKVSGGEILPGMLIIEGKYRKAKE